MPVAYVPIADAEIDPESPVTESLMQRLRDNPQAIIEGASGAPRATSKIITPGGSDADGDLTDATDLSAAGPGFYEFSSVTLTAPKTLPWISRMRVNGDVIITGTTISVSGRPLRDTVSGIIQEGIVAQLRALSGGHGGNSSGGGGTGPGAGGGGGAGGDGGRGRSSVPFSPGGLAAIPAAAFPLMNRGWASRKPSWLLIKGRDEEAREAGSTPITESAPASVLTVPTWATATPTSCWLFI